MKLKGKTKFELTNVETGETRVVKEENMVTNALNYFMQGSGVYGGTLCDKLFQMASSTGSYQTAMSKTNYWDNPVRWLTGGLVLFSDRLDEDEDHIFLTADDPDVTGVGSDLAYIGQQTCAGSYNSVESGPIEGGYKHVWDFTTAQANGDIGCACLTNPEGAGLGFGLNTDVYDWKGNLNWFPSSRAINVPAFDDSASISYAVRLGYFDEGRNLFIRVKDYYSFPYGSSSSTSYIYTEPDINGKYEYKNTFHKTIFYRKAIDFNVYRCPFNNFSLFDEHFQRSYQRLNHSVSHCNRKLLQTVTVDMPSELAALIPDEAVQQSITNNYNWYWPTAFQHDEGFVYISFVIPTKNGSNNIYLESGDKVYTWKINMETFESTWFATTNTTGKQIKIGYDYNARAKVPFVTVSNNYTVLYENQNTYSAWVIDNATGATIKEVCDAFDKPISFNTSISSTNPCMGNLYGTTICNDLVLYHRAGDQDMTRSVALLNLKTGVMKYCHFEGYMGGYTSYYSDDANYGFTHGTPFPKIVNCNQYSSNQTVTLYINPMMLVTINNLEDTVTKTSAETMKVTYIITEEEDE